MSPTANYTELVFYLPKGLANRLTLYTPFMPGEKDAFWKKVVEAF